MDIGEEPMINIEIHNDDRQRAVEILKSKNFGNRSSGFNGNYEKQYTGLIGELTVHRLLGLDPPNYNEGRIDTDVLINNKKVDIKSMLRKYDMRDSWVHNFVGYQKEIGSDVLLFVNINRNTKTVQICGWLDKKNFLETADFYNKGDTRTRDDKTSFKTKAPLYEIKQEKLNKLNNINDLKNI